MARRSRNVLALVLVTVLVIGLGRSASAQTKPEGEFRFAVYVTIAPAWFDPAEVVGVLTPLGSCTPSTTRS